MAEELKDEPTLTFARKRLHVMLVRLEAMAAGDLSQKLTLSQAGDELDAIAHAINVLADELRLARRSH
jgi:hypothetical protein